LGCEAITQLRHRCRLESR